MTPTSPSRRRFLKSSTAMTGSLLAGSWFTAATAADARSDHWPGSAAWHALNEAVGGRLIQPKLPWISPASQEVFSLLKNPFWNEEQPGALQSTGWLEAWQAVASPYAVRANNTQDIVAAVNFAREQGVRLVVKGTGHDYLGRNCAPNSLLVWTHEMREIQLHDAFVPEGAPAGTKPQHAMTVEAGTRWLEAYTAATQAGRFVQGGGCTSVGACGGFTFGSGFGSFSKRFGTASAGILQAEIVTADGQVRVVNAHQYPDLFFALRGGGGGTFGIVSRVTLLTHPIPETVGIITGSVKANSDDAYRQLVQAFVEFYPRVLDNPTWGESVAFGPDNSLGFRLTFLDRSLKDAQQDLERLFAPLRAQPDLFDIAPEYRFLPFSDLWNPDYWDAQNPDFITRDPRPESPDNQFWWTGNQGELSVFWNSYQSRWIPAALTRESPSELAEALYKASRLRPFIFQINKGLSGEHPEARARDQQTALHPQALEAAALVIMASAQQYRYPGVAGKEPDLAASRRDRDQVSRAMAAIAAVTPGAGSYSTEADYFLENWQEAQWGRHYPRLLNIKRKYDPQNLFRVHHGVGSENLA